MLRLRNALWATAVTLVTISFGARADTITIVADEWCPYNCSPDSDRPGYMIEIASKALGVAGHTIKYSTMPWSRAIEEARRGKYTAIVGAARNDAPDFVFPDEPLGISGSVFAVKKGSTWKYTGIDSLATVSIGVIQDYSYAEDLDAYIAKYAKDAKRVQAATGETALGTNIRKLEAGRIDALVEDRAVLEYELAEEGKLGQFDYAGTLKQSEVFIAFSPAHPAAKEYARLLAEGVRALRASGELDTILARYGLKDWKR
ncbi:MAG: amino acid ABC transporter substrate-binding protein [Lysobacteraceae bacterium]|nr:MAG: amino acid ABC transporter substrate-binding protein [Xanthomonadaceae bacterium]